MYTIVLNHSIHSKVYLQCYGIELNKVVGEMSNAMYDTG